MDIVVGGFGELRNAACPGIEQLILKAGGNASNDSDDAALLSRGRLLADVPSPTWMELHTAADGSQVLYAVLEDTNEIASFRVEGGRATHCGLWSCPAYPRRVMPPLMWCLCATTKVRVASSPPTTPTGTFACIR